jgi:hypothetical protein
MPETVAPQDLRLAVERELRPDESIVWFGRPQLRRFRGEKWGEVGLGVLLALVALAQAAGIALVLVYIRDWTVLLVLPVPLVFAWYAFNYLRAPTRYSQVVGRAIYAVTDQRAIVLSGFGFSRRMNLVATDGEEVPSFPLPIRTGAFRARRRRDGTADFVFASQRRGSGRRRPHYVEFGFFGIEDAEGLSQVRGGAC